ncbi:MAG TPA: peptidoglycan DD-metalloendopeptidase family protein [Nostocaceae cyanobacterium]|nr:peptidoglycan DD-metalloendopeptidase family protein [Nostocaceae cyanobacterium]
MSNSSNNQDYPNILSGLDSNLNYLGNNSLDPLQPNLTGYSSQQLLALAGETVFSFSAYEPDITPALSYIPGSVVQIINTVNQAIDSTKNTLTGLAENTQIDEILGVSFGSDYNQNLANDLLNNFAQNIFTNAPNVVLVSSQTFNGAYAQENNTIYLSQEFVTDNLGDIGEIKSVLLEEVGHYLDSRINLQDAPGDEGHIFSQLVTGQSISNGEVISLKAEDDHDVFIVDRLSVGIEKNVTVYEHRDFGGEQRTYLADSYNYVDDSWNDKISSISISPGWVVEAYENRDFGGQKVVWDSSSLTSYVGDYWNDKISSLKVFRVPTLFVINQQGELWGQNIGNTVEAAYRLNGSSVANGGIPAKYVFFEDYRVLVVNQQGEVWAHDISGTTVGNGYMLSGSSIANGGTPVKFVLNQDQSNRILTINEKGEIWAHNLNGDTVGGAYQLSGASVANSGVPPKTVFMQDNRILVLNQAGEVWAHNLSGNNIGSAYQLSGANVASSGVPAKSVFYQDNRILVVNEKGEVWAHNLSGNNIGNAYQITGSAVAYGGIPVKYIFDQNGSVVASGYYSELSLLTDDNWNYQSSDNLFFDGNTQNGESLESVKQVYSDLSNGIFGSYKAMTAGYFDTTNYSGTHYGIDMAGLAGNTVKTVVGGTTTLVQNVAGNYFIGVKGDDGNLWIYGHLKNYSVGINSRVEAGTTIGTVFDGAFHNGVWMPQHLHLEVHKGHIYDRTKSMSPLQAYWKLRNR